MGTKTSNKIPNHLVKETSPYLLQHAYNPVVWFPWGDEALQKAREEDKPILVSIGYAACHWCHVMERESFEDEATAELMNKNFINIKIDREERPDLDHIYMDAVQAMSGSGGWPLNVFLTPEKKPFYGGTYFPPLPAYGRSSWQDVLSSLADAWVKRREEIEQQADTLMDHLQKSGNFISTNNLVPAGDTLFSKDSCREMAEKLLAQADINEGGFGVPPKFLHTSSINYLLEYAHFFKETNALAQAELTLTKMIEGGIYDQLGGGISRYSTDAKWLVPHFEKMLYDNALLLSSLADAFLLTKKNKYRDWIEKTYSFLTREMKDEHGGFYAALDADSEGVEGKFYIWSKEEITNLLSADAPLILEYYNVDEKGNMPPEHKSWALHNILHVTQSREEICGKYNLTEKIFDEKLNNANALLLEARSKRVRPQTDTKIILAWNSLLLSAFCKCYAATGFTMFLNEAIELQLFIEKQFAEKKCLYGHAITVGKLKNPAFLDDLAFYIQACIALQEITGNQSYLLQAKNIVDFVIKHFSDEENVFFYFSSGLQTDVVLRKKEVFDGAIPSANAIMCASLFYLAIVFDLPAWRNRGENMLVNLEQAFFKHPSSFGEWARIYQLQALGVNEIAIAGKDFAKLLQSVLANFIPNKILQSTSVVTDMPLLKDKIISDKSLIFVCRNFACNAPVARIDDMMSLII